jgi:phosphohistidine phosphatase SixA
MAYRDVPGKRFGLVAGILIVLVLVIVVYVFWFCPKTTVIVLRHGERDTPPGVADEQIPLNQAGLDRAAVLAQDLERAGVTAIYVTQKLRTQQTAAPLATASGITPTQLIATDTTGLVDAVRSSSNNGGVVVVINHSENLANIVAGLGGGAVTIGPNEFDNLFVLTLNRWGSTKLIKATYGAPR